MCTFIGIECLAANALIEILDRTQKREVSFDAIVRYGMEVVRVLQRQTGEEAVLLLSKKYQINMIENYSEFFEVDFGDRNHGTFMLRETVSLDDLKNYFRWTMSVRLVDAFVSPEAIRELGVYA